MKFSVHSIKGKFRQRRKMLFSQIESQINLGAKYIAEHQISVEAACQGTSDGFEILMLASKNDLPIAIKNAQRTNELYGDQVIKTTIVSEVAYSEASLGIFFLTDDELGVSEDISKLLRIFGERANWMKQQYLKSKFVHRSNNPVLIVDSDTFLRVPFTWKRGDHQILLLNVEDMHIPYNVHISKFSGITPPSLNFVSHVQLQQPSVIREIYSSEFDTGWKDWARTSWKFGEDSPASEFQTYAAYLMTKNSEFSILFPKHVTIDGTGRTLSNVLESKKALESDIVTIGQKLRLSEPFD